MTNHALLPPKSRRRRKRGQNPRIPPADWKLSTELMKVPTDIWLTEVQRARIIEARQERIAVMMLMGYSENRMAEELGVSPFTTHQDCVTIRAMWRQSTLDNVEAAAILDLTRLDFIIIGQMQAAITGDSDAAAVCLKAIQERGMIFGYRQGVEIDIESHIRRAAELGGFDPDKAVEVGMRVKLLMPNG